MAEAKNGYYSFMRVLSVVWFTVLPPKYGGQKGTALFNQYLSKHVSLTCLCSKNNEPPGGVSYNVVPDLPTSRLQFLNPVCWYQIIAQARKTKAALLILEYPYHALAGIIAQKIAGVKLVLHQHNIEYIRFRTLSKWWWRALYLYERWACRQADLVLFKTEQDAHTAITQFRLTREKCFIVPYGVTKAQSLKEQFNVRERHRIALRESLILFAGTLDYRPNAEAVVNIYQHLAPALEGQGQLFKILICGRLKEKAFQYLKTFYNPHVLFIGEVEGIEPYFAAADVFIDPVLYNGGIQTKILDALSNHCTIVAFEKALEGFDTSIVPGKIISVENEAWETFAAAIQKAVEIKTETPAAFFEHYDWEMITEKVWAKMKSLL